MRIAVIAIQGNVEEHITSAKRALEKMDIPAEVIPVHHSGTILPFIGLTAHTPVGEHTRPPEFT